jgi:hypothetical protein
MAAVIKRHRSSDDKDRRDNRDFTDEIIISPADQSKDKTTANSEAKA